MRCVSDSGYIRVQGLLTDDLVITAPMLWSEKVRLSRLDWIEGATRQLHLQITAIEDSITVIFLFADA
jgi:hypothetical protein